jgi:hypothetical protein
MEFRDFAYWLQGFFELTDPDKLTPEQISMIKEHLSLCFNKVTTDYSKTRFGIYGLPDTVCCGVSHTTGSLGNGSSGWNGTC